jgi:mono/diheme cytochrome c family protein
MKVLAGMALAVLILAATIAATIATGLFNTAATVAPSRLEKQLARWAIDRAADRRAPKKSNPFRSEPARLREGFEHYREMCISCHGAPGVDASPVGEGLNPPAPDLTLARIQERSDGELFWLVQNGIRMTGMPAFGPTHRDEEIWEIVAFLRHLPELTPEEEKALASKEHPEGSSSTR